MGTSSSFAGPKTVLVPSWVDEPPSTPVGLPDDENVGETDHVDITPTTPLEYPRIPVVQIGAGLGSARGEFTRGARDSSYESIRRGARKYVKANGGGRGVVRRMKNSRAVSSGIAGLVNVFAREGPEEALRRFNLHAMAGAPAEDVFIMLIDMLCPAGGTIDEAIAREAMLETIADLVVAGMGSFDEMSVDDLQEFFIGVVTRSIETKIFNEVGTNVMAAALNIAGIERAQQMHHDFVARCVRDQFENQKTGLSELTVEEIDSYVENLYTVSLDLIETIIEFK